MKRCMLKKLVSMMMALAMVITSVSWTDFGTLDAKAASNAPKVEYTFEEISDMANIPVMNLTMADASKYDTLKTDKEKKQNISKFELVNTDGKGKDIYLETTVDEETGENVYPLTAKGRGNSSWTMPTGKKPYNIKFDKKQDILGMGKAKSWCLISNWVDTTYMRNYLAYEMACQLGLGTPDCEMVALCINGAFEGIYLITEKVGLNDYRTEIPEGENDGDVNGDGIVTEIIVEADIRADEYQEPGRFKSDNNVSYVPKDPDPEDLMNSELEEIEKELNAMEAAVMTGANYEDYIDVDSWVDTYIVNELAKNPDFGFGHQNCYASTYLYFREGGKVFAGPVWDFDIAYGRNDYSQMESEGFRDIAGTTGYLSKATKYYKELFENTDFEERVIKRWKEIRETILPTWMGTTFNEGYESVKLLNPIDIEIWGDHEGRVAGSYDMGRDPLAFEDEVAYVRNFINERVAWLDEQWNVDEITKKFSGSWKRWDVAADGNYTSFEELAEATEAGNAKTDVDDIWDGGYGGKEKSGTDFVEKGSAQSAIPGVKLENPITIQMVRQRGEYDWSSDTTHAYDIWKDGTASQGFGGVNDTITVTESGRYVGLTTAAYYVGDTTVEMGKDNVQVYIIDVGTDGSVTLYDGSVALSYEARTASVKDTNYGKIEAVDGGYKVSYDSTQNGNTGTTIGGTGNKQFRIYLPADCTDDNDQSGTLNVTYRPAESNYADVPLKQEVTYVQAEGERPVSWEVEGDAVAFDEASQMITAVKAGTATITATAAGNLQSSVTVTVTEKTAAAIEYDMDPTLGKYYGNTDENIVAATEAEKGSWATIAPGNLARFSFKFNMDQDEVDSASGFVWQTKFADQIIGGAADYYVFVNGNPVFAATADSLDYAMAGFDSNNTIQISKMQLPEDLYAYMNGKAGNTENYLDIMKEYVQAGTNTIDIFVQTEEGTATVLPYICGTTKITNDSSSIEPDVPDVPVEPEEPEIPAVESIQITGDENIVLEDGESKALTVEKMPAEAEDITVAWSSSDEKVVTVDAEGNMKATGVGTAVVTVVCENNNELSDTVSVTVLAKEVKVAIDCADEVVLGETLELNANLDKEVADTSVTWTIADGEEYADLAGNVLTAKAAGTVTVKATSNYNKDCYATKEIKVVRPAVESIQITDRELIFMEDGENKALSVEILPAEAEAIKVIWSSSDKNVVTVDAEGNMKATGVGTATVKAVCENNNAISDTVSITVVPVEVKVTIDCADEVVLGETLELNANLDKEVADTSVTWTIADGEEYADLAGNVLTAKAAGTVTVKATSNYNKDCYATKEIKVLKPAEIEVEDIVITEGDITLEDTEQTTLTVKALPEEAGKASVTWETSDANVATVDEKGIVTATGVGTAAIIAVYTKDSAIKAQITVTVVPTEVNVTINCADKVVLGENLELNAGLDKAVADTSVTWTIADGEEYADLTGNVLTAKELGKVTVKATSNYNDNCYATKEIEVVRPKVQSVEITEGDITLEETKSQTLTAKTLPAEAEETPVVWISSDNGVVKVDANGKVVAVGTGTATITAACENNLYVQDSIKVTVTKMAFELGIAGESTVELEDLSTYRLNATFSEDNLPNKNVTWKSSDTSVATVDAYGKVTAKKPGTSKITVVSAYDTSKTAAVTVKVTATDIKVSVSDVEKLTIGDEVKLSASVDKAVADTSVTWSIVSGKGYATLSGNVLKATAEGTVTVKAVSNYNSNCYATKSIVIEKPAVEENAPMIPGTPLAKPVKISMQLQMGQYEWSANTTHAYDIWADGKAVHGFGKEKYELEITEAGRYVGLTSASYYVGDTTVTMADGDVQVYVIDVANDGSVTVYDGKVKINYAERTTSVVDTTYANVEKTDDGYFLSFKEDGTGNAGTRIANK